MWRVAVVLLLAGLCAALVTTAPRAESEAGALADPSDDIELADLPLPVIAAPDAPRTLDELRARIAAVLVREQVPGVGIALVGSAGPIWIGGVGVMDEDTRAPVTADTVFRVASITKSVVALGVMRLVEQGKLDLDQPLRTLMPDVAIDNPWEAESPVTLGEALEHTAGLDDMRPNDTLGDNDAATPLEALAINPATREIRWRPGTRMAYSNVGYTIAGHAIEVATGEPFDVYLRREILQPLGIADADFRRTDVLAARLATGYDRLDAPARYRPMPHRPAGGLLASPADLARIVELFLRRGPQIVTPASLARIERTGTLPYPARDVDYGLGNYGDVAHPVRSRGHDGGLPGFVSVMRYFPELGVGYVTLFNSVRSWRAIAEVRALVYAYLVRDRAIAARPAAVAPAEPPGADYFAFASPRHELFAFAERVLLGFRASPTQLRPLFGDDVAIVPAGDGGYKLPFESGSSLRFTRDRDGAPIMLAHHSYSEAASYTPVRLRADAIWLAWLLLELAPLWLAAVVALALVRRRRMPAVDLALWPAIAGLCAYAFPHLLGESARLQISGEKNAVTIAVCITSYLFAISASAAAITALRWMVRADRPPLVTRLVPTLTAIAAVAFTCWGGANGFIGLRTWLY